MQDIIHTLEVPAHNNIRAKLKLADFEENIDNEHEEIISPIWDTFYGDRGPYTVEDSMD